MNPEDMTVTVLLFPDIAKFDGDLGLALYCISGICYSLDSNPPDPSNSAKRNTAFLLEFVIDFLENVFPSYKSQVSVKRYSKNRLLFWLCRVQRQ